MYINHPQALHDALLQSAPRRMGYTEGMALPTWRAAAVRKLEALLGLPLELPADDAFEIEWTREGDGFVETRFTFLSESLTRVPCHLLLPAHGVKPLALIVCLQGHSTGMHISLGRAVYEGDEALISGGDRDFCLQAVRQGFAALAVEQRAMGERGGNPKDVCGACYRIAMDALLLGRTLLGERVWDVSRAIDCALRHFDALDPSRVAVMGNSGGGATTIYAAALDGRIAAAMPSCALGDYASSIGDMWTCSCNYIPHIAAYFDMGDLLAMAAPRSLVVVSGVDDALFPMDGVRREYARGEAAYRAAGAPGKCRLVVGGEGHRFYAALARPVFHAVTGW